jgi:hypothetical protein
MAVRERRGERGIATDERGRRVVVALGLEDLVALYRAELTDRAIHRADQLGVRDRPRTGLQRACEELVEARVVRDVGGGRLGHVHAVLADEPADQRRRARAAAAARHHAGERGQCFLRQQVLRQDVETVGHR